MRQNKPVHPPFKESSDPHHGMAHNANPNSGQALVEYVLILVLVAIAFGVALAATGPVLGNVFSNSVKDLLRQTEVVDIPDREQFWETVTYAFLNPPRERPLQSNTPAPPTTQPTAGPSPTPSNTFTATPETPTLIHTPTPTPEDIFHEAPWRDTVDDAKWYRTDPNLYLHEDLFVPQPYKANWRTEFFNGTNLAGAPIHTLTGLETFPRIDFVGVPFYAGGPTTDFSIRATRTVSLKTARSLRFSVKVDDGVRVLLNGTKVDLYNSNGVLVNDTWIGQPATLYSGYAPANAGENTIVVEYKQQGGNAAFTVDVQAAGPNIDDSSLGGGSTGYACNWGRPNIKDNPVLVNNANTEDNLFEEYVDGSIPTKSRCYLELRGGVAVPDNWNAAELSFWDVWDFTGSGLRGWLEVAEYVPVTDAAGNTALDRSAVNWQRIDLRDGVSANFNWTHNKIDLSDHINFANLGPERLITFRFVIENDSNTSRRRWYIDDIIINRRQPRTITVDKKWTLDDLSNNWGANNSIYNEFIFTGGISNAGVVSGWELVGNNKYGPAGQSFHDSVGAQDDTTGVAGGGTNGGKYTDYKRHLESPNTSNKNDARAHSLEIDGYVDLTNIPLVDSDGNPGPPILAFYQGYDVGNGVGLEVQYTTASYDVPARDVVWTTFTDGKIRDLTTVGPGNGRTKRTAMQEHIISLQALPGNPARIRIRWVMYVSLGASERFDGWWIDQIRLGREEAPKWADYPFKDDAQVLTLNYWRFVGQWGPTEEVGRQNHDEPVGDTNYIRRSWSSSPGGTYSDNESTWMELRYPVDLYNDTPNKLWADPSRPANNNNTGGAAVKPELHFYHSRDLAASDNFLVQWRRLDETEAQWRTLWVYNYRMATNHTADNVRTAQQKAWEPVYIDLNPVKRLIDTENNAGNRRDDDIVIRFVLQADGSSNATGIRIDDVRIAEKDEIAWKLWPSNENRGGKGTGNGVFYLSEADTNNSNRGWWEEWSAGGYWFPATFEKSSGALAFHDSSGSSLNPNLNQQKSPDGIDGAGFGEPQFYTPLDTFNVLQLNTIIDLREVNGLLEEPTMYFWWRHDMGRSSQMLVQVSTEMTGNDATIDAAMPARCKNLPVVQCYEQVRGWTRWETLPNFPNIDEDNPGLVPSDSHWYAWTRAQVDLRPYAFNSATNNPGKRIRVRFVLDNLDATSTWDGWYIDNVYFEYRNPPEKFIEVATSTFGDYARNMENWVAEGNWGLAPDVYQGGGGGPVNLGLWDVTWWTCGSCNSANGSRNLLDQTPNNRPVPAYSSKPFYQGRGAKPTPPTDTVAYNMGNGSPVPGWNVVDKIVGEFDLDTGIVGSSGFAPGNRSFLVLSDDGIRMKVDELDGSGNVIPRGGAEWNLINTWKTRSPASDSASFNFEAGKRYRIVLQYFEASGGAVLVMSIGDGRYSFTDSPKFSSTGKDIPPIAYGNSSLISKTVFDLSTLAPNQYVIMEFHSMYKVHRDAAIKVEVSNNGGFDWVQDGLRSSVYINGNQKIIDASAFSGPTISDAERRSSWHIRQHNLTSYRGQKILLRFRMDRQLTWCVRRYGSNQFNACRLSDSPTAGGGSEYDSMFYDGWWITPVIVEAIQ